MTMSSSQPISTDKLDEMIAEADTGKRAPKGRIAIAILFFVPLCWSLFQLWIGSPLPSQFGIGFLNDTQSRAIHLAFAVLLAFMAFPASRKIIFLRSLRLFVHRICFSSMMNSLRDPDCQQQWTSLLR
jgi:TRAP-type uncharacterized transport system fused permease subunit